MIKQQQDYLDLVSVYNHYKFQNNAIFYFLGNSVAVNLKTSSNAFIRFDNDDILINHKNTDSRVRRKIISNFTKGGKPFGFMLYDIHYLQIAKQVAELSYCDKKKVGALIVDNENKSIISEGFNGNISGFDNICEDCNNKTLSTVLHAESNAIMKVAKSANSTLNKTMYITLGPCINCAKLIIQSGIKRVVIGEAYDEFGPLDILLKSGIEVWIYNMSNIEGIKGFKNYLKQLRKL